MRAAFATLALAALAFADPIPSAVSSAIAPSGTPPAGCYPNYKGTFEVGPVNISSTSKRDIKGNVLDSRNTQLGITLVDGVLHDPEGRTGYVAANSQFQFDKPPQAGAIWTAGFSVCDDGRLTLGSVQTWYKCLSGDFYNLYFKSQGGQCIESYLIAQPMAAGDGPSPSAISSGTSVSVQTVSNSKGANSNSTMTSSSSVMMTGNHTTATTAVGTGKHTITTGGTTATVGGTASMASSSSSSASASAATGAAPVATMKAEMLGLAAGVLAMAVL